MFAKILDSFNFVAYVHPKLRDLWSCKLIMTSSNLKKVSYYVIKMASPKYVINVTVQALLSLSKILAGYPMLQFYFNNFWL